MTGHNRLKGSNTLVVGGGDTAEERLVQVGRVGALAVSRGNNARVHARRVAVPKVNVDVGNRLASVDIDDLDVHGEGHALLRLGDVLANVLARDIVGSLSHLGHEDAAAVAAKEILFVDVQVDAGVVGKMGRVEHSVEITNVVGGTLLCITRQIYAYWTGSVSCLTDALQTTLLGQEGLTADVGSLSETTSLELVRTLAKGAFADGDRVVVGAALESLGLDIMTRVRRHCTKEGCKAKNGLDLNHDGILYATRGKRGGEMRFDWEKRNARQVESWSYIHILTEA